MYCRKCQRELQEHSAYCPYCGTKQSKKVSKWIISLTLVSCLLAAIIVTYIVVVRPVKDTEYAIEEIGSVKMESLDKIEGAEALYESLSENAKARVNNYSLLKDARDTYDRMEASIQNALNAIEAAKNATFYADDQPLVLAGDQDIVERARTAYDALEAEGLTEYVEDHLVDLVNAEKGLEYTLGMDMYSAAIEKADQGQYQEAIDIYRELMATYPNHELALIAPLSLSPCIDALAKIEVDANRYEDALSLYQQALEVNPIDVEAMTGAMNCTIRLLEPEFKEENLEMIVKILDKAYEAYGNTEEYDAFREKVQKKAG